jgi:predicted membrane-bound spermidine synthase
MRIPALYATSVISGFCLMALEIVGPRYLSNRFGSSVDVWAAIISTFVISWSIGSWLSGRVADKTRSNALLGWTLLLAGALFLLLPVWASAFIDALPDSVHAHRAGALLACLILFMPPFILLGGVSPMLIRLLFTEGAQVARTTGTLYAISSIGNILGILVTNYFFLEAFPLNGTTLGLGASLAILGLIHIFVPAKVHLPAAPATGAAG